VRNSRLVLPFLTLSLLASGAAFATVNHGNFPGSTVDFNAVSETTLTADPEPLWEAPTLAGAGDQLAFFPTNFTSACSLALGAADTTASELTTEIVAHPGTSIDTIMLAENGDVTLTKFPPFGDANTNASAALSGTAMRICPRELTAIGQIACGLPEMRKLEIPRLSRSAMTTLASMSDVVVNTTTGAMVC